LLLLMAATVFILARNRNLFAVVALAGVYSFLMGAVLVALDAVDVAMTEAAVGAGISTVLLVSALALCKSHEARPAQRQWVAVTTAVATGAMLMYGTFGLPSFSDPQAAIHQHVVPRYLEQGLKETGVPNIVTAVLASYRGYDTLGETSVVFTAGIGVIALLRHGRQARRRRES
jgi:multicomponent Na+:H+ antiporter subunit B